MIDNKSYCIYKNLIPSINQKPIIPLARTFDEFINSKFNLNKLLLWSDIDKVSENIIDHLAYQLHVDEYDMSYSLDVKREMVKQSIAIHKHKGTRFAVENAVAIIYESATLEEWFEYGGEPYKFRITGITAPITGAADINRLVSLIDKYKNKRSWLEYVRFTRKISGIEYIGGIMSCYKKVVINSDFSTTINIGLTEYYNGSIGCGKTLIINTTVDNDV